MKLIMVFTLGLFLTTTISCQNNNIEEIVSKGIEFQKQGKYENAIAKFNEALNIDQNSSLANYQLSYAYLLAGKYDDAIKYSKLVIKFNSHHQELAYNVLGGALEKTGKIDNAIKTYEEGLIKFPNSNLLNYNLARSYYEVGEYDKGEKAAINAILADPTHESSHIALSSIMDAKGERIKALLPLYYFLMIEPKTERASELFTYLKITLGKETPNPTGIVVEIPSSFTKDSSFVPAEKMISSLALNRFKNGNEDKSDCQYFVEVNKSLFSMLKNMKNVNDKIWYLYINKFYSLIQTNNYEAFSYYISQSDNSLEVDYWIKNNQDKIKLLNEWLKTETKHVP